MERVNTDEIEFGDDYVYRLNGHPFTGIGFEISESSKIVSEIEFQDGMQHGISREWSCDGDLVFEYSYVKNTRHGPQREWSKTGTLLIEEMFEHGICIQRRMWNDDGTFASEYILDEDERQFKLLQAIRSAMAQDN